MGDVAPPPRTVLDTVRVAVPSRDTRRSYNLIGAVDNPVDRRRAAARGRSLGAGGA
jgi:hypothetical protein